MSLLAVVSPKGGVGKTTLALNLAYAFAHRGWETVLVDFDPLGGLDRSLFADRYPGLWDVVEEGVLLGRVLHWGERDQARAPALLGAGHPPRDRREAWGRRLASGEGLGSIFRALQGRFPLVVLDTPAGLDGPTRGALLHATHVVSPVQAEPLALRTLPVLLDTLSALGDEGARPELVGLVASMVRSREKVSLAAAQELFRLFPPGLVLDPFIPWDPIFLDASARGEPVVGSESDSRPVAVASVFDQIAEELAPRLGLAGDPRPAFQPWERSPS